MIFQVKKTRKMAPVRAIFHGPPGIGKSTLAASAPNPIFVSAEDGLDQIDAAAVDPAPRRFEAVLDALLYIATLNHKTVVVDSLDWLEPLVWEYAVQEANSAKIKSIEDFGYGKGYIAALDYWRLLIKRLDALRAKGMHVILIAHSVRKIFKNPMGDDYEQWTMKLHDKATGLLVEWAQVVGFCDWDIETDDSSGRAKALTTGKRIIRTNPNPAFLAKTRFIMPSRLAMPKESPWEAFAAAMQAGDGAVVESLSRELEALMKELGDAEIETKARSFLQENGATVQNLSTAIERMKVTISESRKAG